MMLHNTLSGGLNPYYYWISKFILHFY